MNSICTTLWNIFWFSSCWSITLQCRKMLVPLPAPLGLVCLGKGYLFLSSFCFVSVTNGINLTDGLDGLAGGIAALAFIGMSIAVLPICSGEFGYPSFPPQNFVTTMKFYWVVSIEWRTQFFLTICWIQLSARQWRRLFKDYAKENRLSSFKWRFFFSFFFFLSEKSLLKKLHKVTSRRGRGRGIKSRLERKERKKKIKPP